MNRNKEQDMKDARQMIMQEIEQRELESIEFNEEMISRD